MKEFFQTILDELVSSPMDGIVSLSLVVLVLAIVIFIIVSIIWLISRF